MSDANDADIRRWRIQIIRRLTFLLLPFVFVLFGGDDGDEIDYWEREDLRRRMTSFNGDENDLIEREESVEMNSICVDVFSLRVASGPYFSSSFSRLFLLPSVRFGWISSFSSSNRSKDPKKSRRTSDI